MINKSQKQEKAKKTPSNQRKTKENMDSRRGLKNMRKYKNKKCNET